MQLSYAVTDKASMVMNPCLYSATLLPACTALSSQVTVSCLSDTGITSANSNHLSLSRNAAQELIDYSHRIIAGPFPRLNSVKLLNDLNKIGESRDYDAGFVGALMYLCSPEAINKLTLLGSTLVAHQDLYADTTVQELRHRAIRQILVRAPTAGSFIFVKLSDSLDRETYAHQQAHEFAKRSLEQFPIGLDDVEDPIIVMTPDIQTVIIGRSPDTDLTLSNLHVSSVHARIDQDEVGNYYLIDMGSANGTYFKGHRLATNEGVKIKPGEFFHIANVRVQFTEATTPPHHTASIET